MESRSAEHEAIGRRQRAVSYFAAIAVNQDCLFAFPTDERTLASKSLRIAIDDEFRGHRKPVSQTWLRLGGGWPVEHPLSGNFNFDVAGEK
ncbi:hypothetical protein CEY04_23990 [Achromobacter sp. HZ28]|nr:hypothetical protein CEY05_25155 [Achromobacter sp. HZ34]OWT73136.1 hypothetical protein CEY04_23990 [Achromobacter sp. HZ28]